MTKGILTRVAAIPVPAILFVLGLGLFIMGAYLVSPWYVPSAPVNTTFDNQRSYEIGMGVLYVLLGGSNVLGMIFKNKWLKNFSATLIMMGYFFLVLLRIIVIGLIPLVWLPLLICALIAGICRLTLMLGRG